VTDFTASPPGGDCVLRVETRACPWQQVLRAAGSPGVSTAAGRPWPWGAFRVPDAPGWVWWAVTKVCSSVVVGPLAAVFPGDEAQWYG